MTNTLRRIETVSDQCAAGARALLTAAAEEGFAAVVIVGIFPDGRTRCDFSRSTDALRMLGALELAKSSVMDAWADTPV